MCGENVFQSKIKERLVVNGQKIKTMYKFTRDLPLPVYPLLPPCKTKHEIVECLLLNFCDNECLKMQ